MILTEFLNIFYQFNTDINKIVLWQNGKRICNQSINDTRYICQEYKEMEVKKFTFPKKTHALYVILENKN